MADAPIDCDLCGEPVVWGEEPHYGGTDFTDGKRPEMGPPCDGARHYRCHEERFGRHKSAAELTADWDRAMDNIRKSVDAITGPGGALSRLAEVLTQGAAGAGDPPLGTPYKPRGACARCGRYEFNHPLPDCPSWQPPRM